MWSDKETSVDLLGHTIHASILKEVVTNEKNLPITIGLYGDWESGKSSILKILENELYQEEDVIVVYFDGWAFESFDDAKMALIQGIVDALEKEEKFFNKVGDKLSNSYKQLKSAFTNLRKSIDWMRILQIATKSVVPIATAAATGGASMIIPTLLDVFRNSSDNLQEILKGEQAEEFLKNCLKNNDENKKYEVVREFRKDFEKLIEYSKQGKIVVLIDDLDRCLPRHIIDNLEAIKLFLNVPKTAFVIAADQFIVSNAIKSEYEGLIRVSAEQNKTKQNLGDSYMEKFIQLPYTIPPMSRKEVETYITLLFCQSILPPEQFATIQKDFAKFIIEHKFDTYNWERIEEKINLVDYPNLDKLIGFIVRFSSIIGSALRWNPRLIKRFLNAYEIRSSLLEKSGIKEINNKFALLKLMLLEQKFVEQFKQLNRWTLSTSSIPKELKNIEEYALNGQAKTELPNGWDDPELLSIMAEMPYFSTVDLRELFWVSRDQLIDEMSGISLIPRKIKSIFNDMIVASTDSIMKNLYLKNASMLTAVEWNDMYELLNNYILSNPTIVNGYKMYYFLIIDDKKNAYQSFIKLLKRIDVQQIPFSMGVKFKSIYAKTNDSEFRELLSSNEKLMRAMKF